MDGVSKVADVDDPHGHTDQGDDLRELLAELVQLLLQRRLLLLRGCHLVADFTDLGVDARSDDDADGAACGDVGALRKAEKQAGEK